MNIDINFQDFKCRCSRIGDMMSDSKDSPALTEKQEQELKDLEKKGDSLTAVQSVRLAELIAKKDKNLNGDISDSHAQYLLEVYAEMTEGIVSIEKEVAYAPAIEKGLNMEQEAAMMISKVTGRLFKVHKERITNDYLSGELDLYEGESPVQAYCIIDVKNSIDYVVYLKKIKKKPERQYVFQVQGYIDISNASEGYIGDVICTMPAELQMDYVNKLVRKHRVISEESGDPDFRKSLTRLLQSMDYQRIDERLRVNLKPIQPFSKFEQQKVYDRVKISRDWLCNFHNDRLKLIA